MATPWAILLCRFNDDATPDIYPRRRFEEIFTAQGHGKWNMVDYLSDVSHGRLDLSGSTVFPPNGGFYTLTQNSTDYLGDNTPAYGRGALQAWARAAAAANGDDLSGFYNIVVVTNTPADLFGSLDGVSTDDGRSKVSGMTSLSPSILGQEMLHGYGVDHARIEGSVADYKDPFDIMSTASARMADHPAYSDRDKRGNRIFRIGPGLNAATMDAFGWLDHTRVWTAGGAAFDTVVELRPLHRRDLQGFLCARVGNVYVEFRMNEQWDAALASPVVLVHDYFDGHSYLHPADDGGKMLTRGDTYSEGDVSAPAGPLRGAGMQISVTDIDVRSRTATVRLRRWADQRPRVGPAEVLAGITNDAGGIFIVNGHVRRVPPRSPLLRVMQHMFDINAAESMTHVARQEVRQQGYQAIAAFAGEQAARGASVRVPARETETDVSPKRAAEAKATRLSEKTGRRRRRG